MADNKQRHVIADQRGGMNTYDAPWAIRDNECVEAVNVDFYKSRCGRKRNGMLAATSTGSTTVGTISSLFRHVPGIDETAAEMWSVDDSGTPIINRLAAGTTWAAPTLKDAPTGNGWDFTAGSINGKLALAYKSAQARMHFWDGSTVRRGGLPAPAAPTLANQGAGAYPAVLTYFRVRWTVYSAGIIQRRSEPGSAASITPSGGGASVRVTQPTVASEGETNWEVEGSTDGVTFYVLSVPAIGTTFVDISTLQTAFPSFTLSDLTGKYTLQKPYKFIAVDQNRLLGFGSYTTTDKQSRVEISAVIGSADISDEERVDTSQVNSYIDLDENDSGSATGLAGPVLGSFFAFKERQVWQLTATGVTTQPFRQDAISKSIGALAHYAITRGEDAVGNAAIYWMSHRGPYRWSLAGLEYLGRNIESWILGGDATINLSATKVVARTIFHPDKRQVWFWWATGSSNDPNQMAIFDVQSSGWTRVPTGEKLANVRCVTLFANTIAASMSRDLKPYVGQTGAVNRIWKTDTGTDDNGTTFQSYLITKASEPGGPGFYGQVGETIVLAKASPGVMVTVTVTRNFGAETITGTADLSQTPAEGTATRVSRVLGGSALNEVQFVQYQIGDAAPVSNTWLFDRLVTPYQKQQPVAV